MSNEQSTGKRSRLPKPIALTVLVDVVLIGVCLVVFALFDHVIPRDGIKINYGTDSSNILGTAKYEVSDGDFSEKFADKFTDGEVIQTENSYQSANVNITVSSYETKAYDGRKLLYHVQDIYIRNTGCLRTLLAEDTYGRNIREDVIEMSKRCNAVAAINSDYYSFRTSGVVLRDGVMYRDTPATDKDRDVLLVYYNGDMRVIKPDDLVNYHAELEAGAWQGFCFGPSFLEEDGSASNDFIPSKHNPRTILGMYEPGHYAFIVVEGRNDSSSGLTYDGCAYICEELGLAVAYNLDGGDTSQMTFMGEMVNTPSGNGRTTSDIIYIVDQDF